MEWECIVFDITISYNWYTISYLRLIRNNCFVDVNVVHETKNQSGNDKAGK